MNCVSEFLADNYDELLMVAKRYVGNDAGDLLNDLCLHYLTSDDQRLEKLCREGDLMKYMCRSLAICGFSKTTPFYYKYKKCNENIARNYPQALLRNKEPEVKKEIDYTEDVNFINSILRELDWFDAQVFTIYYMHNHSLKTLSDGTGISKSTLYTSIKKAEKEIKEIIKRLG